MRKIDFSLLLVTLFLTFFGLLMIYDASSFIAFRDFGDKYYYIKEQIQWVILGFVGLFSFTLFDYKKLYNLSLPLIIISIMLLVLVFIPGIGVSILGAKRWINTGIFLFQPAEFVKLSLAIYLSAWFSRKEKGRFGAFLLLMGLVFILILFQPDMGTAGIILFESLIVYFLSGGNIFHFLLLLPAIFILGLAFIKIAPYRAQRFLDFLNIYKSIESSSYHMKQILIGLGMGGLTGVGLGNSLQKYAYLPENTTDSIFAIIGEELGFLGGVVLIVLFVFIMYRGFMIGLSVQDKFGKLLASSITAFLSIQTFFNLGSQTGLIPLTGVPLPFISYGGSSLIIDLCSVGILLSISKKAAH